MKFEFFCDNEKEYIVEAASYADARDAFGKLDWQEPVPRIVSYCAYTTPVLPSVLRVSLVA